MTWPVLIGGTLMIVTVWAIVVYLGERGWLRRTHDRLAVGLAIAALMWLLFVKIGPFHQYYYPNSIPGWNSMKYDRAIGDGCEALSRETLRCPFWVSL